MATLKISNHIATLEHLKSKGFRGSHLFSATKEEVEYLQQHTTVREFPNFTVEVLMADGEFITAEQYNSQGSRHLTVEMFEKCRAQLGM